MERKEIISKLKKEKERRKLDFRITENYNRLNQVEDIEKEELIAIEVAPRSSLDNLRSLISFQADFFEKENKHQITWPYIDSNNSCEYKEIIFGKIEAHDYHLYFMPNTFLINSNLNERKQKLPELLISRMNTGLFTGTVTLNQVEDLEKILDMIHSPIKQRLLGFNTKNYWLRDYKATLYETALILDNEGFDEDETKKSKISYKLNEFADMLERDKTINPLNLRRATSSINIAKRRIENMLIQKPK